MSAQTEPPRESNSESGSEAANNPPATAGQAGQEDTGPQHSREKYVVFGVVTVVFTILDQASKIWVRANIGRRDEIELIDGFLSFIHAENPGAAFSLLRDSEYRLWVFGAFTIFALWVLGKMVWENPARERMLNVALALVLSGALGNAIDRAIYGTVTDFIRMYTESPGLAGFLRDQFGTAEWPTYNVADIAIVVGLGMIGFHSIFLQKKTEKVEDSGKAPEPSRA